MFSTGGRIGEIVSLEKNHINWTNQSAIVRGKGDKEREVYFKVTSLISAIVLTLFIGNGENLVPPDDWISVKVEWIEKVKNDYFY